jgi:predicted nucleotide-binding protein (sugar kinase/HSP70/actin superfamily)
MGEGFGFVVDSDGNELRLDDPRVAHVWTINYYRHASSLLSQVYKRRGWRLRCVPEPSNTLLREAKRVCSGKECPALNPVMGGVLHDLEHDRRDDEVTLYYGMDCVGPCPAGAWPLTCDAFVRKLGLRNVVFPGHPAVHNNYFGQGILFAWELFSAFAIADILAEAELALRCTARDQRSALATFEEAAARLAERAERGLVAFEGALRQWARTMSKVPLRTSVRTLPTVRMIGGGNGFFFHQVFMDYFAEQGVLVRLNPMTDFILHVDSDLPRLVAFEASQGAEKQFAVGSRAMSALTLGESGWARRRALIHAINVKTGAISIGRFRKIASASRLLYGNDVTFARSAMAGDGTFPDQLMLEATGNVGLLSLSIDAGVYDGGFHSNSFHCFHGAIGQALSKELATRKSFPFVALELDEVSLTAQNSLLLETLCAKARSRFERRSGVRA